MLWVEILFLSKSAEFLQKNADISKIKRALVLKDIFSETKYVSVLNVDNNFDEQDPNATILIRFLAWHLKFEKRKALKKKISEELRPIAWHPKR